jgi:hypothetical protein
MENELPKSIPLSTFLLILILIFAVCSFTSQMVFNYIIYKQNTKLLDFIFISSIAKTTAEESVLYDMLKNNNKEMPKIAN